MNPAPALTLWSIPVSIYGAKVRIALRRKGLAWTEVPPPDGYGSAAYKAIVPQGTIPAIETGGFRLADSEAINEWLEERFPDPPLLAGDAEARAVQRMLSRFHDTRLEPALRAMFPLLGRRPAAELEAPSALLATRLADFVALSRPAPLLGGETLGLADCGYPITFVWIEAVARGFGLPVAIPSALDAYRAALAAEPAVAAELAGYVPAVAAWVAARKG